MVDASAAGVTATNTTMSIPEDRSDGVVVTAHPRISPRLSGTQIQTLLELIRTDILPLTKAKVATGSKMFGAAILDGRDFTLLHADTNDETTCALFHGEVKCIYAWSKTCATPAERRETANTAVFLSTHEPCCMCISSILWSGFHTVYYLFSYQTTAAQGIPYDIQTMHELWGVNTYRKQNKYLSSIGILELIEDIENKDQKAELKRLADALMEEYDSVSKAQDVTSTVMS